MRERGVYGARNALASIDVVHQVAPNDLAGRGRQPEAPLASREGVEGEAAAAGGARRAEAPDDVATVVVQCCEEGFEGVRNEKDTRPLSACNIVPKIIAALLSRALDKLNAEPLPGCIGRAQPGDAFTVLVGQDGCRAP